MHIRTLLLSDFQPDWKWRLEKIKCTNCTIARQRQHRVRSNVANNSSKDEYIYKKKYISWVYFNHVSFGHRLAAASSYNEQVHCTMYDVRTTRTYIAVRCGCCWCFFVLLFYSSKVLRIHYYYVERNEKNHVCTHECQWTRLDIYLWRRIALSRQLRAIT